MSGALPLRVMDTLADGRRVFQLKAPSFIGDIAPGHVLAHGELLLPIMRIDAQELWLVGDAQLTPPELPENGLHLVGQARSAPREESLVLSSEDDGVFALIAWLFQHRRSYQRGKLRAFCQFSGKLPFRPQPSPFLTPDLPPFVTASIPLLDDWGIVSRLCHPAGLPGCFDEPEQWQHWLAQSSAPQLHFAAPNPHR